MRGSVVGFSFTRLEGLWLETPLAPRALLPWAVTGRGTRPFLDLVLDKGSRDVLEIRLGLGPEAC